MTTEKGRLTAALVLAVTAVGCVGANIILELNHLPTESTLRDGAVLLLTAVVTLLSVHLANGSKS